MPGSTSQRIGPRSLTRYFPAARLRRCLRPRATHNTVCSSSGALFLPARSALSHGHVERLLQLGQVLSSSRPSATHSGQEITPITRAEETEPTRMAHCCHFGVAPTRKPVLRSCEVVPPLEEAMHTTAATESAISDAAARSSPRQKDQARQQQRGDGHAGDRIGRRADLARQPRGNRDEQETRRARSARRRQIDPG